LAALREKKVVVTFFVMGIKVEMHPDIVAAALNDGHEIGNHV
jgi:peptidoglycan/xylan/chitin deacetylase (PgdA/CDA1 family)